MKFESSEEYCSSVLHRIKFLTFPEIHYKIVVRLLHLLVRNLVIHFDIELSTELYIVYNYLEKNKKKTIKI